MRRGQACGRCFSVSATRRRPQRTAIAVVLGTVVGAWANVANGQTTGSARSVAESGQTAPGGGFFQYFSDFGLDGRGQVAFSASLSDVPGGFPTVTGVFQSDGVTLTSILREGQAAPDGNGTFGQVARLSMNNVGQVAFEADLIGTSGQLTDRTGIFRGEGGPLTQIARAGQAAPNGNGRYADFGGLPVMDSGGRIAFAAQLRDTSGGVEDRSGIFIGSGDAVQTVVRSGQSVPGGPGRFVGFSHGGMNDSGQVAFHADLAVAAFEQGDRGIYRGTTSGVVEIAREEQLAPDGNERYRFFTFYLPQINSSGQVSFSTDLAGTAKGEADDVGLFIGSGGAVVQIAREGQDAPDGNGRISFLSNGQLSDSGQVVFRAFLTETSGGTTDDAGLFRGDGGSLTQIARKGQVAPNRNGVFASLIEYDTNAVGQVAFQGVLAGTVGGVGDGSALFFFDDHTGLVEVARMGATLFGGSVAYLRFTGYGELDVLNEAGQLAFHYTLTDGRSGIAVWSVPEPASIGMPCLGALSLMRQRRRM